MPRDPFERVYDVDNGFASPKWLLQSSTGWVSRKQRRCGCLKILCATACRFTLECLCVAMRVKFLFIQAKFASFSFRSDRAAYTCYVHVCVYLTGVTYKPWQWNNMRHSPLMNLTIHIHSLCLAVHGLCLIDVIRLSMAISIRSIPWNPVKSTVNEQSNN